ncbi:Glycoside hydrolase family 43 protein [Pleurostoma richardsiae]|uniref:Glycoside hydrolase family 43 protein n=1 Tax=Pleurostoma richardsiae TaxID=41990 RepID=A0AA38VFB4_9PEZI|nr:Glycoside hydrolase family 43 protein [Pleurostoma richardsiae]
MIGALWTKLLVFLASNAAIVHASLQIVPGATWAASNGEHLQAHGAGVIQVNGTFHLIGEDKSAGGSAFQGVNCYSSADLVRWQYEGALLSRAAEASDLGPSRVIERPKVLYNERTGKYVMWMHIDSSSYGEAKVGVATGDSVCGKYTYIRSFQPLGFQSRDMGLFKDDDGTAYLLSEDRQNGLRINKLTTDYLDVKESTYLWKDHIEAPAMVKVSGRYHMFGSKLTGWDPNDNVYSTSTSLTSGWTPWAIFADKGSNTYSSQTNFVLAYGPSNVMYMGDRWQSAHLDRSTYVWLPLTISGTSVSMKNRVSWVPNVGSGAAGAAWQAAPAGEGSYEGEKGVYAGGAKDVTCGKCSGGKAAGYTGGSDGGKVTISGVGSDGRGLTTVRVQYVNGDAKPRYAGVTVNGGATTRLAFLPSGGDSATSVLNVMLASGSDNTVVFGGVDGGWAPDIDRLVVPVQ